MGQKAKILAIDDNRSFRQSLEIILSEEGYNVDFAKDSEEGKTKIIHDNFDIVLLDLKLPAEREGLEVLDFIKKHNTEIVVIMMTGYGDVPTAVKAIKMGAEDFIEKDSEFEDHLLIKLEKVTEKMSLIKDRENLIQLIWEQTINEVNSQQKGKLLEQVCTSLFKTIPGFEIIEVNMKTADEEIDIILSNNRTEGFWLTQGPMILVECKNWSKQKVGKNEFVLFKEKIINRVGRSKLGFLISTGEFAETVTTELVRSSQSNILITPINGGQLKELVFSKNRLHTLQNFINKALLI